MYRWRRVAQIVNIVVASALLSRIVIPYPDGLAVAHAASLAPAHASDSGTAPAAQAAPPELATLLNLLVRQTMLANGWSVVSLTSQLSPAANDAGASQQSGTGDWQIGLLDENQEALALGGRLSYQETTQAQASGLSSAELMLSGTLEGEDASLVLDLSSEVENNGAAMRGTSQATLELTRKGQTTTTSVRSSSETGSLAYGLIRSVTHTSFDRGGTPGEFTQIVTTRVLGKSESEVWLQVEGKGDAVLTTNLVQHVFQRVDGTRVMQYLDRFDLKTADHQYSLQSPTGIVGTTDGELNYAITLVDQNGKILNLTQGKPQGSLNWAAPRVPGLAMPPPIGDIPRESPRGEFLPITDVAIGRMAGRIPLPSSGCGDVHRAEEAAHAAHQIGDGAELAHALGFAAAESAVLVAHGAFVIAAGRAATGTFGNGCNADPYFVAPDSRPSVEVLKLAPVQITRVTGGLVSPPAAAITPAPSSASGARNVEYRDRAEILVGGALPQGATSIGSWTWDAGRAFRASASHTQPPTDGPQLHYFIHASQPLKLTADDDIIQYVYLDPQNPPSEIYVQFYVGAGDGEHRAYWGEDLVQTGGKPGTASLFPMGALPDLGTWLRLRIPADSLGLVGEPIHGVLFGAYGGQTWWGPTTSSSRLTDTAPDSLALSETEALPQTEPGALIAFRLRQAGPLTIEIVDTKGAHVRTLANAETRQAIYQVVVWDARDDGGALVGDRPYWVQFRRGSEILAQAPVTISPFVASLTSPGAFSVLRGVDVPIFGEAYGDLFDHYVVEYGAGLEPGEWKTLIDSSTPTLLPSARALSHIRAGNLANWNVGLDELTPWTDEGLAGVFTLRLRVIGKDGREASDTAPVIIGRLASFPHGGTIASADGQARLVVPPLATENSFALLSLVPVAQVGADESWRQSLPGDRRLAGTPYEIFPADERFRQDVTLELPYDAGNPTDKLGILLGDGTPGGWRYLGGTVDPQNQTIGVALREFGETRALVAAFVSDDFGPPNPLSAPAAPLAFDVESAAPTATAIPAPFAFYTDLESSPGEWAALDVDGTELTRVEGPEAGLGVGGAALRVTRLAGGVRLVRVRASSYDAAQYPILGFDYRVPPGSAPDLLIRSNGAWWQLRMGSDQLLQRDFRTLPAPRLVVDEAWHHYQIDLLSLLRAYQPQATSFRIDAIALGQVQAIGYRQYVPVDSGEAGSAYYIANFAALAPVNTTTWAFAVTPAAPASGYSFTVDQEMDTLPAVAAGSASDRISVSLPVGAPDGAWYLHLRAQGPGARWSAPAHIPLVVDRQPPEIGEVAPAPNGAGSPDVIEVPVRDAGSGLDATGLHLVIQGQPYDMGSGFVYSPERSALRITPGLLQPDLPFIANGQEVQLAVSGITDYAGNTTTSPLAWSFTADRPTLQGDLFRQLTVNGGEAPAVSPDGSQVAFVSSRSGTRQIWIMRSDDYEEAGNSARPLISGTARESDPAWSPDGAQLAFVSDATGASQIWVAAPDGTSARALTAGEGGVASPTWSPDGRQLVFVRDGNLWAVNAEGSAAHALTSYPERPFQSVRWQPGGQLLAVDFKLYQETVDLYDLATGVLRSLTEDGREHSPEWLNPSTLLYAAPAGAGQPDAVWQIHLDGTGAAILPGSGQPGVGDLHVAAATGGSALAMVSTRAGGRDIWVQANLQIPWLTVSPSGGAPPGSPIQISYALPADAQVSLEIVGAKTLLENTPQAKGEQNVAWDGRDANGRPVAPGDYVLRLTARMTGGGEPIERFASARVIDPADIGTLQVQVQQWANTALRDAGNLRISVYPWGGRLRPVAEAEADPTSSFNLPAGEYDVVVSFNGEVRRFDGIEVEPGATVIQVLDLQLGGLQVAVNLAPGRPLGENVYTAVTASDDPLHALVAEQWAALPEFVLPPGRYDLRLEHRGLRQNIQGVVVRTGHTTRREIDLGAGTLQLDVLGYGGQPADPTGRLIVDVFDPRDHQRSLMASSGNPLTFLLPAGRYDIRIAYGVAPFDPHLGGTIVEWLEGVEVRSGQTAAETHDLHLGEVNLDFVEAPGRPTEAEALHFHLTPLGDAENQVARASYANAARFQLTPGTYQVFVEVIGTAIRNEGVGTIEVKEGEAVDQTIDLHLARLSVEVYASPGKLSGGSQLYLTLYPAGTRDTSFAYIYGSNPLESLVRAGQAYDVVIRLDDKTLEVNGVSLEEGTRRVLQVSASDFK